MFYDKNHFTRQGAMPPTVVHLLQDQGSVQALDGDAHRQRKRAFLDLMSDAAMQRLGDIFDEHWDQAVRGLPTHKHVVLHQMAREVLTRTACQWSGIDLDDADIPRLSKELGMMVSRAGQFGPGNWYAQWRRRGTEQWATKLVEQVRAGERKPPEGTVLEVFAHYRDSNDERLSPEIAAVEVINILRPTLAVARFIAFAAVALHKYPKWRETFAASDESDLEPFVQEVRRYYPFFPVIAGRVNEPFSWGGHRFKKDNWVVFDIYGTCHDTRLWNNPDSFQPERFRGWDWEEDISALVAQGAGHHSENHRCPGEWSTIEILKRAVRKLAHSDFSMPVQDLSIPLNRLPALPRSGVIVARN